ncbi:MAG: RsmB/NOP family class I SAM-dependent RNA methyltransferase [Bacteroidota bacterium]
MAKPTIVKKLPELPVAFVERLGQILSPDAFAQAQAAFAQPRVCSFRVNTLLADPVAVRDELAAAGLTLAPVGWMPVAFTVPADQRTALLATPAFAEQRIYVQNLSSMVPPVVLAPQAGERILDLTAAPGSKTLQVAAELARQADPSVSTLAAVEFVQGRFFKLRANLKAQGAAWVETYHTNGENVWRHRPSHFDRVLLDAPCSSEGRFHASDPESWAYWSPRKVKEMARKQQRLLYSAVHATKPGGSIVYSTCSFAPEENERILAKALKTFGDALTLEPLGIELPSMIPPLTAWRGKAFPEAIQHARRILPNDQYQGFFVARLRKV